MFSIKKRIDSFRFAGKGIREVYSTEINMKIHLVVSVLVITSGVLLGISVVEWMICLVLFALVFSAEVFNTAIESVVDLVSPDKHELARKAKDLAAGAVLVTAIFAAIVGLMIFVPKFLILFIGIP
ncbi:MAG: diacylglycerol kinase family protein [Paludibacteraceae bacterium]|nr:diacylglycerol kinase family protein [Paludibacteraceae bacterium]